MKENEELWFKIDYESGEEESTVGIWFGFGCVAMLLVAFLLLVAVAIT
jgi:hypothetical protein